MADEHGDLVTLILVFVAAVLLAAAVWLLMRKYRADLVKSFECTPPRLASPIPTPQWDSSLLLGTEQLRQQQSTRLPSIQEQSASASRLTSTAADTSQADQSKVEAEDKSKPPLERKVRPHRHQSGSTVLRDSKGAAKRPAKTKDAEASRKKSRTSAAVHEKSITTTKRRSKHRRPEKISPEVFKTATVDKLSAATSPYPPQEGFSTARAAASSASTTAASPPAAAASATDAAATRNPAAAAENVTQTAKDQPQKTSPGEELSPVSAATSMQQAATSTKARGEDNL